MGFTKVGDWARVGQIAASMRAKFENAVKQSLMKEAHFLRGKIVENITKGTGFAPLSPMTLAMRQARGFAGSKPLISTGALRRSITVVQVSGGGGLGGAVFVGVHRATKGPNGRSMVDLASIHEFGRSWTQNLSPKARAYLFMLMKKAGIVKSASGPKGSGKGSGTISITIPARPFIRPAFDIHGRPADVKKRFIENVLRGMGGDFKKMTG